MPSAKIEIQNIKKKKIVLGPSFRFNTKTKNLFLPAQFWLLEDYLLLPFYMCKELSFSSAA